MKKKIKKCWSFDCFMNHSCIPNVSEINSTIIHKEEYSVQPFKIIAINNIKSGDEITTNYLKFEYDNADPFNCNCGNLNCYKTIKGFKYLTPEQKEKILSEIYENTIINEFKMEELNNNY